jgi:hypothetical protein
VSKGHAPATLRLGPPGRLGMHSTVLTIDWVLRDGLKVTNLANNAQRSGRFPSCVQAQTASDTSGARHAGLWWMLWQPLSLCTQH